MKKLILSSALVLALCFSFTSCREKKEADKAEEDRKSTTSELQSRRNLVCRLLLEKKK